MQMMATYSARPSVAADAGSLLAATRVPKFLRSLYDMLFQEDPTILAWAPEGQYFQIFDTRRLEAGVLPKYFKHSKFASFQRQLNNFGFRKWTKTQSSVCTFSHQHLVRCHPLQLAELVSRQATSPSRRQPSTSPGSPPNGRQAKRPRDAEATAAIASGITVDSRISPRAAKHIKREHSAAAKASPAAVHAMAPWDLHVASQGWSLDPLLFAKPEPADNCLLAAPTDVSTAFSFNMDELSSDVGLAGPDAFERTFELRMLNECLDLAPPSSSSFVGMLTTDSSLSGMTSFAWDAVL